MTKVGTRLRRARRVTGLALLGVLAVPALGQAQTTEGDFSCRASALRAPIIGEPWVANPQYTPCATDQDSVPSGGIVVPGLAKVYILDARTGSGVNPITGDAQPRHNWAWASVAYADITVGTMRIRVWGLSSTAGSQCLPNGTQDLGGSSTIVTLAINNTVIPVFLPNRQIPLPLGLGTLHINYGQKTDREVVTRAVWLDFANGDANDIVISEARAARPGPTCQPPPAA